jgi:hypothetical protein
LTPLKPLSTDAARQTFIEIAEDFHEEQDINQVLSLTDNLPLAVDLIAHLVDYEGCSNVLARWDVEKTSMLSEGFDKRSNLDASITLSLSSPRISSSPGAQALLSLLSILPDGLSDAELLQSQLPIKDVLGCKAVLLSTSLAYVDDKKRLKSLVPIREHMQSFYPPSQALTDCLQKHFHLLLDLFWNHRGLQHAAGGLNQISLNLGNLQQVLQKGLDSQNPNLAESIKCVIALSSFTRVTAQGYHPLMDLVPAALLNTKDDKLEIYVITEMFSSAAVHPISNGDDLIAKAISHFHNLNDPVLECESSIDCF